MIKDAYWLINSFSQCSPDEAKLYAPAAYEAKTSLVDGVGVIGKLLTMAGTNEDAPKEINQADLTHLGLFLENLAKLQRGLDDANDSLQYALRSKRHGGGANS